MEELRVGELRLENFVIRPACGGVRLRLMLGFNHTEWHQTWLHSIRSSQVRSDGIRPCHTRPGAEEPAGPNNGF